MSLRPAMDCQLNGNEKRWYWLNKLINNKRITLYPLSEFEVHNGCTTIKECNNMVILGAIFESHDIAWERFYSNKEFANEVSHYFTAFNRTAISPLFAIKCVEDISNPAVINCRWRFTTKHRIIQILFDFSV